jgi:hypothetical protein
MRLSLFRMLRLPFMTCEDYYLSLKGDASRLVQLDDT